MIFSYFFVYLHITLENILSVESDDTIEILDVWYVPPKSVSVLFCICKQLTWLRTSWVAQMVKNLPVMQDTQI